MVMASKNPDSAILNLGDIGEENAFSSTITPSMENIPSSLHTFEDKIPDSALDLDEDEAGTLGRKNFTREGLKSPPPPEIPVPNYAVL